MKTYKTINNFQPGNRPENKGHVLAIGNFDGVHKGHQTLLGKAGEIAKKDDVVLSVLTFEPHPRRLFRPDDPPFRITPENLKQERLQVHGVENIFSLPFDWDFASLSAGDFIRKVLDEGLKPKHIIVGQDFCFGQLRKGSPQSLRDAGYNVTIVEPVCDPSATRYSSSMIRQLLRTGKIDEANAMLGWEWEIQGIVEKGDQRGRELGYPTANVPLGETVHPGYGIYATFVQIEGEDRWRPSATNIGIRPMFEIPTAQVESFIFDFDGDLYGKKLRIKPVKMLRGEAKFESLDALIIQMEKDCAQARMILNCN